MATQDNKKTVKDWFQQLVGLDKTKQATKLAEIKQQKLLSDAQIDLLQNMLQADDKTDFATNIQQVSAEIVDNVGNNAIKFSENQQIGIYKIIKPLGEGGMGSVYLAARNDGTFEQKVALKLPHSSFNPQMLQRFENERQILAQLTHNNIAHLLDGGTTENNQPFLVMEYIQGVDIEQYCVKKLPNLRQRIDLIIQICAAVSFAHQKLVLHRDLKPSNILVTDNGQVKLLDFGIAKLLDDNAENNSENKTATQIMTRNYASPEQIQGKAVGTQSDLFSLAVIAYEIITGFHPFKSDNPHEREQHLVSGTITKITKRVNEKPQFPQLATIPASKIAGDLENILLKALHANLQERYQSVKEFADDLNNFCNNRPVKARKPSFTYTFAKLIQRHKIASMAILLTIATLISSSIYSYQKAKEANIQKDEALQQKRLAQLESDKSNEISLFLKNLFLKAKPDTSKNELTAQDLLKQGLMEINKSKTISSEHKYEILAIIYESFLAIGKHKLINISLDSNHHSCVNDIGKAHISCQKILISAARMKMNLDDYATAVQMFSKAETIVLNEKIINRELLAEINTFQFIALLSNGQRELAITKTQQAISFYQENPQKYTTRILDSLNNLATAQIFAQTHDKAKLIIDKMPEYLAILPLNNKPNYQAKYFNLLGFFYETLNQPKKSAHFRGQAIDIIRINYEVSPVSFAWYLYKKGKALARSGEIIEPMKLFLESRNHYVEYGSDVELYRIKNTIQLILLSIKDGDYKKAKEELEHLDEIGLSHISSYFTDKCDLLFAKSQILLHTASIDDAKAEIIEYEHTCKKYFNDAGQDNGKIYQAYLYFLNAKLFFKQNENGKALIEVRKIDFIWNKYPEDYLGFKNQVENFTKEVEN